MGDVSSFGQWVRRRRQALGLTQDALAQRARCTVSMIRKLEADERRPSRQLSELLVDALGLRQIERGPPDVPAHAELSADQFALSGLHAPMLQATGQQFTAASSQRIPRAALAGSPVPRILQIQLLGNFRLVYGDEPVTDIDTARSQSLLAYLVLHRGVSLARQQLAFTFWPDSSEPQAHNNLRQALYHLRHTLVDADRFLSTSPSALCWRIDSPFSLDVADFEHALAAAAAAKRADDPAAARAAFEQAVALYCGDLLPGRYEEWVLPERERLRQQYYAALDGLVHLLEAQYDLAAAIHYAQRLLQHDPLHEETYRRLMRLHILSHNRGGALRVYHACITALERELGVDPSPETHATYERILAGAALSARPAPAAPVGQPTGTVTFLSADIENSTRLWEEHPDPVRTTQIRLEALLRQAMQSYGGYVFKTSGDQFCVAFTSAQEALAATLALVRALQAEAGVVHSLHPPIHVRAGLHTGMAELRDSDYFGPPLSRVAYLQRIANPGQVVLSQVTAGLLHERLPEGVTLRDLGEHRFKDLARTERIFQLVAAGLPWDFPALRSLSVQLDSRSDAPPTMVALAPLVGRQTEWARLQSAWQAVEANGPGLVLLRGEAGIGKSRLAEELLTWAEPQGILVARTRSYTAEGRLSYASVTDWLRSEDLRPTLARLEPVWLTEVARLLPELLTEQPDLPPPQPLTEYWERRRFFEALARAVLQAAQPLLLLIDDLQWCDQETIEWLHYLLRFDRRARLLVVGTARAEEVDERHPLTPMLADLQRLGQVTEIALGPLDAAETTQLICYLAGRNLDVARLTRLYRETEGNPLFVVEMLRAGLLEAAPGQAAPLPQTVQTVISARLAQLSASARALAGLAATIGRAFTYEVLARASDHEEAMLVPALDELWRRRVVREQNVSGYDFSHDKLREVAYAELGPARRRWLHRRVAEALEAVHADNLDPVSAQLAAHYEQAGGFEQAIGYYQRAAAVAQRTYAVEEAISLLHRGLAVLKTIPPGRERDLRELNIQTELGTSLVALQGYTGAEVSTVYERARNLCAQLGQSASPPILRALAITCIGRAQFQQAIDIGHQLMRLTAHTADSVLAVEGNYVLGVGHFWQGTFGLSREHLERAIAHYGHQHTQTHLALYSQDPLIVCLSRLAYTLWCLGYPDQALQVIRRSLDTAHTLGHPTSLIYAATWSFWLLLEGRSANELEDQASTILRQIGNYSMDAWLGNIRFQYGWARATRGQVAEGIQEMKEGASDHAARYAFVRAHHTGLLAEQCAHAGQVTEGLALIDQALAMVHASDERWCEAELYRRKGEILLQHTADSTGAEKNLTLAITIARSQDARSFELRAATNLSRLWQRQGRIDAARELLGTVYSWFTEGFGTPDLQDARALLEEIG